MQICNRVAIKTLQVVSWLNNLIISTEEAKQLPEKERISCRSKASRPEEEVLHKEKKLVIDLVSQLAKQYEPFGSPAFPASAWFPSNGMSLAVSPRLNL